MQADHTASMRPRHEASENDQLDAIEFWLHLASMRPRHEASENQEVRALADYVFTLQ